MKKQTILAFSQPPAHWGFRLAKSGKCWWISIAVDRVLNCRAALKKIGIKSMALRIDDCGGKNPRPSAGNVKSKPSRQFQHKIHQQQAAQQAMAVYQAGILEGRKQARIEREQDKYDKEHQRQAIKRTETDAQKRASEIATKYLAGGSIQKDPLH